jgi:hypothetical protein
MAPDDIALSLADWLIAEFDIGADRYTIAYSIMAWDEQQESEVTA